MKDCKMADLIKTLMQRDKISQDAAIEMCLEYNTDDDPEDFLREDLGLEPDYVFDLLDIVELHSNRPISN